ncbi:hypothetical protein PR202_ga29819 [Eleusine coracana subsp. coracana]|uniref:ATP-dependent RNA helicase n=1 Tax=Eleusine coracana subsp. coracana TaxID=191504 RepID=A0AAV5DMV6_ELECO|nr:hypothetical protein PR202_ga29819 [Eleusine coracana subsp. coracana]
MGRPQRRIAAKQSRLREADEIRLLDEWIDAGKPLPGTMPPLPSKSAGPRPVPLPAGEHPAYGACTLFDELPLSQKTKDGLRKAGYKEMSDIQRAAIPHALCGRDVLGAAKTGSGKTLAFVIPVLEKLYRERWGPEDGVGGIILSPTTDLAGQIFEVFRNVGKAHTFSAGAIVGKRKGIEEEKTRMNYLNIIVCTPGRLVQHFNETPNFDCSNLQILVLDEADQILDHGFRSQVDAILSQIPKARQTLLFSATQTKSVKDLSRVSLKDPQYISVHEEARTATPDTLEQYAMIVPLEQKLNMLWSFIKRHLNSKTIVFLSSVKQVKFVFEVFKKLRPGIPLKCMHGRMHHHVQQAIVADFNGSTSVLFSTDISSRGLDIKNVDWVVQVDCPESIETYIHRVGRTARYNKKGKALIFLCPEEERMLEKLNATESKIPIHIRKKKLKINVHRPVGTRVKYDDEGNIIPPLASVAEEVALEAVVDKDKVSQRYAELYKEMQKHDKEDKLEHKKSLREKKLQKKLKLKRKRQEEAEAGSEEDSGSESDRGYNATKKAKKYFDSDDEGEVDVKDGDVLAQQEELALKLLSKMHS